MKYFISAIGFHNKRERGVFPTNGRAPYSAGRIDGTADEKPTEFASATDAMIAFGKALVKHGDIPDEMQFQIEDEYGHRV